MLVDSAEGNEPLDLVALFHAGTGCLGLPEVGPVRAGNNHKNIPSRPRPVQGQKPDPGRVEDVVRAVCLAH